MSLRSETLTSLHALSHQKPSCLIIQLTVHETRLRCQFAATINKLRFLIVLHTAKVAALCLNNSFDTAKIHIPNRRIGKINRLPVNMFCAVQVTVLKHKKSHNKLVKINTRKILIHKLNKLALLDSGVALALVGWQAVGARMATAIRWVIGGFIS